MRDEYYDCDCSECKRANRSNYSYRMSGAIVGVQQSDWVALKAENARLREALEGVVSLLENDPTLPARQRVLDRARQALGTAGADEQSEPALAPKAEGET